MEKGVLIVFLALTVGLVFVGGAWAQKNSLPGAFSGTITKIDLAKKEIVVQACTEDDQKYLDLDGYDMVVVVNTFVYLDDGSLLQYGQSRHRPDKFKFVDFARRIQQVNE